MKSKTSIVFIPNKKKPPLALASNRHAKSIRAIFNMVIKSSKIIIRLFVLKRSLKFVNRLMFCKAF